MDPQDNNTNSVSPEVESQPQAPVQAPKVEKEVPQETKKTPAAPEPVSADKEQKYRIQKETELSNDTNKKAAKIAVQAVATYFGGGAGGAAASAVNDSGVLDPVYDKIADATTRASEFNPLGNQVQKTLNKANEEGVLDAAGAVMSAVGSKGGSAAANAGGQAANAAKGANAASKAGTVANQAGQTANTANQTANAASKSAKWKQAAEAAIDGADAMAQRRAEKEAEEEAEQEEMEETQEEEEQAPIQAPPPQQPPEPPKQKTKGSGVLPFLMAHPGLIWVLLIGGGLFLIFIVIMTFILGAGGTEASDSAYVDTKYDFNSTKVLLTNTYAGGNKVVIDEMMLEDLIIGATYLQFYYDTDDLKDEEIKEMYKTFMIVAKSLALSIGQYSNETMEIEIQSGRLGLPYCDPYNGCKIVENNGEYTYYPGTYESEMPGTLTGEIPAMKSDLRSLALEAYSETKDLLIMPKTMNEVLTTYTYGNPPYNSEIRDGWIEKVQQSGMTYDLIIKQTPGYEDYKIYDIKDYAIQFSFANTGNSYWWPIGSSSPDSNGLYSGNPISTKVTSEFGNRLHPIKQVWRMHTGIDIGASCGTPLIATKGGTVTKTAYDADGYGYYVIIDHGDNVKSLYAHMLKDSFKVSQGQTVSQGQLIGSVGTTGSSTGCHLHFEIRINNDYVNPLDYVSASNPRPASTISNAYISGSDNAQTVCLSLKQSGFSDDAVAALMTNINAESGFRPAVLGDNGTSIGLCQWHNGRYTNLMNYCGSQYKTIACQLDYLMYELTTSYKGVYNKLLSNSSAYDIANYFCLEFERPANKYVNCPARAQNYSAGYLRYVQSGCNG